jgi:SAM-dependent methyltransferase
MKELSRFPELRAALLDANFTEPGIAARLGIGPLSEFVSLRNGRQTARDLAGSLDVLVRLFLDGDCVEVADVRRLLGANTLVTLQALNLVAPLEAAPQLCYGTVALYPAGQLYIVSDRSSTPDGAAFEMPWDAVYPVSGETRRFLETLPPIPCERLLDLGTGTGVAALEASRYAGHAWAFDITARAARFAEFNRLLNGIENVTVGHGDLYLPAAGMDFDRIVAHPPYVPAGAASYAYRDGGEDGEQVTRRIVEGLPRHLAPGGRFYGYAMASDREGEFFEQRIRRWLGKAAAEFDVLLIAHATVTPDHVSSPLDPAERQHWDEVFKAHRVRYLFHGSIIIERHANTRLPYTVRTQKGPESGWRESEWLRDWMAAAAQDSIVPAVLDSRPRLSSALEVQLVHRVREGALALDECTMTAEYPLDSRAVCHSWMVQMISRCDGRTTGRDLLARCRSDAIIPPDYPEAAFARVLCGMISGGFLEIDLFPLPRRTNPV